MAIRVFCDILIGELRAARLTFKTQIQRKRESDESEKETASCCHGVHSAADRLWSANRITTTHAYPIRSDASASHDSNPHF
jgi:hypothetical protein